MNRDKIIALLKTFTQQQVFFGPQGFAVISDPDALAKAQHGYSFDADGGDLTGTEAGDWKASWLVVASDLELGDPYFVDTDSTDLPVYTAIPGAGHWLPQPVATSLQGFVTCLTLFAEVSKQDGPQIFADSTTMTSAAELEQLKQKLVSASGVESFWRTFFEQYQDWLDDDDDDAF